MTINERLVELNKAQSQALAEYYGATKALERAEEKIRTINQQITLLAEFAEEPDGSID